MAELRLENVQKAYGAVTVIDDLSLTVEDGEFVSFVGPVRLRQVDLACA